MDKERELRKKEFELKRQNRLIANKDRIVPSFENEDRALELKMKRIATAGGNIFTFFLLLLPHVEVVKLFNAFRKQQQERNAKSGTSKATEVKLNDPGPAERLSEKRFQELLAEAKVHTNLFLANLLISLP